LSAIGGDEDLIGGDSVSKRKEVCGVVVDVFWGPRVDNEPEVSGDGGGDVQQRYGAASARMWRRATAKHWRPGGSGSGGRWLSCGVSAAEAELVAACISAWWWRRCPAALLVSPRQVK